MPTAEFNPWLLQGDIFGNVPIVETRVSEFGTVAASATELGCAVLVTDNCILTKRTTKKKTPKAVRLHFAPVRLLTDLDLDANAIEKVQNRAVNPPEPVYLDLRGLDPEGQECAVVLGEMYYVPVEYFGPLSAASDEEDTEDSYRVKIAKNDTRIGTMNADENRDLVAKMSFFWLHAKPPAEALPAASPEPGAT